MKIRVAEATRCEGAVDVLKSPEYKRTMQSLQKAFREFESKVKAAGYKLVIDRYEEYSLTAVPAELDVASMDEPDLTELLDNSYGLGNEPIIII